jgi:riboflavin biosynthesis pyrimidine reductase
MSPSPVPVVFDDVAWPEHVWFRSNILLDDSGSPAGVDGTSRSLTRGLDRALLRALRQDAEAIVTGGETVRSEGWHFPTKGLLFVASQGQLPLDSCPRIDDLRVFRFSDAGPMSLISELTTLTRACNIRHLLCESGPSLLRNLFIAELIDEAFVSIAHLPNGNASNKSEAENTARRSLALVPEAYVLNEFVQDAGVTYLRFARRVPRTSPAFIATKPVIEER